MRVVDRLELVVFLVGDSDRAHTADGVVARDSVGHDDM